MRKIELPRHEINAPLLERGPVELLDLRSNFVEIIGRDLARPVSFDSFFHLTVSTYGRGLLKAGQEYGEGHTDARKTKYA